MLCLFFLTLVNQLGPHLNHVSKTDYYYQQERNQCDRGDTP